MQLEPILIVPDAHVPYEDPKAWELMLLAGKVVKPKHLIVIGDLADFYSVSNYSKDPSRAINLKSEVAAVNKRLDQLDALGATNKIFVAGNHENRLERYLSDKAPELFGLVSIPDILHLKQRNWTYVPYKHDAKLGKLYITHDVGATGRNSVHKAIDTYQHTIVTGHSHRMAYVVEGNAVGEYKLSVQFGWLGDVNKIDYMHKVLAKKNWPLGFGVGYLEPKSGIVYLSPIPIVKNTCVVNGKLLRV